MENPSISRAARAARASPSRRGSWMPWCTCSTVRLDRDASSWRRRWSKARSERGGKIHGKTMGSLWENLWSNHVFFFLNWDNHWENPWGFYIYICFFFEHWGIIHFFFSGFWFGESGMGFWDLYNIFNPWNFVFHRNHMGGTFKFVWDESWENTSRNPWGTSLWFQKRPRLLRRLNWKKGWLLSRLSRLSPTKPRKNPEMPTGEA